MLEMLAPIHERRVKLASDPSVVDEILAEGSARAREKAEATMKKVRAAMHLA